MNLFIRSGSAFVFCLLSGSVIAHGVARSCVGSRGLHGRGPARLHGRIEPCPLP